MSVATDRFSGMTWLKRCIYLLLAVSVLVNIKSMFTDFDSDLEYAVGMSYRMLKGDRMFVQMWEPHQTSAFLLTFFMGLYFAVTKTTTGVVLFLQGVGVLLQGILVAITYQVLKKRIDPSLALLMSVFLFTARPKGTVMPEFSNMQIGFSVLLFLCLLVYLENQEKKRLLLAASVCLCLQILSYPSCVIVFFAVVMILFLYSDNRLKDILWFGLFCLLQGICYVLYFVWSIGIPTLLDNIPYILSADDSHSLLSVVRGEYFLYFGQGVLWLLICSLAAFAVGYFWRRVSGGSLKSKVITAFGITVLLSDIVLAMVRKGSFYYGERTIYVIVYLVILFGGCAGVKYCNRQEKRMFIMGLLLTLGSFLAVFFLTNLDLLSIIGYLILGTMISFLPLGKWLEKNMPFAERTCRLMVLLLFCAMVIFRRGYITRLMNGYVVPVTELTVSEKRGMIRKGPAAGIVTEYMVAYTMKYNVEDFKIFINPGDRLLVVSLQLNALLYMYQDVTISTPSTICTTTYNETLLDYWEKNPDKSPNVIVVEYNTGELQIVEDSWIYQWIENEFQPSTYQDGAFCRFYRLDESAD